MLLAANRGGKIEIYNNVNNQFTAFQTLTPSDGGSLLYTGVITDDHEWVLFGTYSGSHIVDVYKFDGQEYKLNQTISIPTNVRHIAITPDHQFLVVGTHSTQAHLYKHNGSQFSFFQSIGFSLYYAQFVSITDDH